MTMAGAGAKVPIGRSVKASVEFLKYSLPRTYGILALVMLANLAAWFMGANPAAGLMHLVSALFGIMASGALLRLAFVDEHRGDPAFRLGPLGLQWAMPEWRLLGGVGLLLFLVLLAVLTWVMVVIVFGGAAVVATGMQSTQAGHPSPAALAVARSVALVFLLVGAWVAVRVSLYPAATVANKRIQVFSTWPLTKGQFWPIFASMFILLSPSIIFSFIASYTPVSLGMTALFGVVLSAINAFIELPLLNGLYAFLYQGLRPVVVTAETPSLAGSGPWAAS